MLGSADEWIARLRLEPLEFEGGYFREVYRSDEALRGAGLPARYGRDGERALATTIYYLLTPGSCSSLHRLASDEIFTFVAGDVVRMIQLFEDGAGRTVRIGNTGAPGVEPAVLVPRHVWQGSRLEPGGRFALLTTTMAPGFDLLDFEAGDRAGLVARYPTFATAIAELTPER